MGKENAMQDNIFLLINYETVLSVEEINQSESHTFGTFYLPFPVSYTHLDVYKRQPFEFLFL